jgi:hypothetical protein
MTETLKVMFDDEQMAKIIYKVTEKMMRDANRIEVVRCKDCIAFDSSYKICKRYGGMAFQLDEYDYCSFGERKTDDTVD